MAANNRSERQLMRQRGAGLRDVNNVDFGLKFGTLDSREDRQLMRQRGAGNRNITNVDFGFSFPTPSQSRRSSRTPQTIRRSSERLSKTPGSRRSRQPSERMSLRKEPAEPPRVSSPLRNRSATPKPVAKGEQPNSSKRRRLNNDIGVSKSSNIVLDLPPRRLSLRDPSFSIVEENETEVDDLSAKTNEDITSRPLVALPQPESPLFVAQDDDKENYQDEIRLEDWTRKPEQNRSLLDGHKLYNSPPPEVIFDDSIIESIEGQEEHILRHSTIINGNATATSTIHVAENSEQNGRIIGSSSSSAGIDDVADSTTDRIKPAKRRKKRKSVILGPKKRRSLETRSSITSQLEDAVVVEEAADIDEDNETSEQQQEEMESETSGKGLTTRHTPLWKKLAAKRAHNRRTRLSVSVSPSSPKDADEDGDETYVEEDGSPEPITPALKKRKTTVRNASQGTGARLQVKKGRSGNRKTFPITIHRITNAGALPTITEESELSDGAGEGMNAPPATFSNRAQPNAVDVLAQICRETIQSAIESLSTDSSAPRSRAEVKQKRTALEAFGGNLDQRLFEMSEAVEHRMTLEARLRKSKREKAELQARWLEVRRQRDDTALKADMIRRQNWETEEEGKRQWEISELVHQTELALDSNDSGHADLEFKLKEVADQVSSAGSQGGILGRIRSFNKRLEKIAATLEAKQA